MEEKLTQLQAKFDADGSFAEKLFSLESPVDVQNLLKEIGLDFSLKEIDDLRDAITEAVAKMQRGELNDQALEEVAGGLPYADSGGFVLKPLTPSITTTGPIIPNGRGKW